MAGQLSQSRERADLHDRAVFLDRDGVLVRAFVRDGKAYPPQTLDEFELLPGVTDAVRRLSEAGFRLVVATNQPDVATGRQRRDVCEEMHRRLLEGLPIDGIEVCYHTDSDNCLCRKPKPGMLFAAAAKWSIRTDLSYMVGDSWRDVGAGKAAGCKTILLKYNYNANLEIQPDLEVFSLWEASEAILHGHV
ncbi:MAG TPA: HAD family hydrolase [Alphaproteobacteria bacterium]|nr:HAD family hydrolase [Alphaproteobacteria bacterium]